jgi:hypothetical protein
VPRRIVLGLVLLILPWIGVFVTALVARQVRGPMVGPAAAAQLNTPALIASLSIDSPWEWQEMERRLQGGELSGAEIDASLAALTTHFNTRRASGQPRQPLHWAGTFVTAALASGNANPQQVQAMCRAYYGDAPAHTVRSRAREGEPIAIVLGQHESWELDGMKSCWALMKVTVGGTELTPRDRYNDQQPVPAEKLSGSKNDAELHLALAHALPPSEHELVMTFERGVLPEQATLRGIDGRPGLPESWPQPVARWQAVVTHRLIIVPKGHPLVSLIKDPARDPFKSNQFGVKEVIARRASNGVELEIKWNVDGDFSPCVSYRVWVQAGDQKIDCGGLLAGSTGRGQFRSYPGKKILKHLPPEVTQVDVVLVPDPAVAEQQAEIEEIWGQELEFKAVPLERYDLDGGSSA